MRWESENSDTHDSIKSDVGQCVPCLAGTYSIGSVDGWVETCSNCSAGEYVTTNGSSTCFSCPRGRFSTRNASTECEICTSGHYTGNLEEGSDVCLPCEPGKYTSSDFEVECDLCSEGKYTSMNGSKSCERCLAGTIPHQDVGSKECELLPAGKFGDGDKCPVNTYSDEGAAECTTYRQFAPRSLSVLLSFLHAY